MCYRSLHRQSTHTHTRSEDEYWMLCMTYDVVLHVFNWFGLCRLLLDCWQTIKQNNLLSTYIRRTVCHLSLVFSSTNNNRSIKFWAFGARMDRSINCMGHGKSCNQRKWRTFVSVNWIFYYFRSTKAKKIRINSFIFRLISLSLVTHQTHWITTLLLSIAILIEPRETLSMDCGKSSRKLIEKRLQLDFTLMGFSTSKSIRIYCYCVLYCRGGVWCATNTTEEREREKWRIIFAS